jgi:hypothetical protein
MPENEYAERVQSVRKVHDYVADIQTIAALLNALSVAQLSCGEPIQGSTLRFLTTMLESNCRHIDNVCTDLVSTARPRTMTKTDGDQP